uniref:Uncharacterized protein n=1 Tax=Knipowitschia caucasica TaxID=637954 RepID=A0AAV2MII5_KNICA
METPGDQTCRIHGTSWSPHLSRQYKPGSCCSQLEDVCRCRSEYKRLDLSVALALDLQGVFCHSKITNQTFSHKTWGFDVAPQNPFKVSE